MKITQFIASSNHSLALTKQGAIYSWGDGSNGKLGLGVAPGTGGKIPLGSFQPQMIKFNTKIKKIDAGVNISLALAKNGKLFSWGRLEFEKPKFGDVEFQSIPQQVFPETIIKMVACGYSHCMAVASSNELYSWGNGQQGCLGHGDQRNRSKPSQVMSMQGKRISAIACGDRFSIILTDQTRGLEPNQKITLKTVLSLTATKAIASRFLTKVRNNILERNKKLRDKRLRNVQTRSQSSSRRASQIKKQNTFNLPQIRNSRNQYTKQKSFNENTATNQSVETNQKFPDIRNKRKNSSESSHLSHSSKISKSFNIGRERQGTKHILEYDCMQICNNKTITIIESKEMSQKTLAMICLINKQQNISQSRISCMVKELISCQSLGQFQVVQGRKQNQLIGQSFYMQHDFRLYKQTLNANLLKFQYPDFFASQFQISQIDKQLKTSSIPDKAKIINQIVHLLFVSEQSSPLKIIKQIKKKYEVSTAARTQGLSVNDEDPSNNSPLIVEHNPYTLQRKKIGLSQSTKKQKIDSHKMIKESAQQLNIKNSRESPVKMKRMAMKMNLQLLIKKLNDEDLT